MGQQVESVEVGDNTGMLAALRNPVQSVRTKHIDVAHHFARELVARKEVTLMNVPTERMVADALTKAVQPQKFVTPPGRKRKKRSLSFAPWAWACADAAKAARTAVPHSCAERSGMVGRSLK